MLRVKKNQEDIGGIQYFRFAGMSRLLYQGVPQKNFHNLWIKVGA
jgi:hypothetical protein